MNSIFSTRGCSGLMHYTPCHRMAFNQFLKRKVVEGNDYQLSVGVLINYPEHNTAWDNQSFSQTMPRVMLRLGVCLE